MVALVVRRVDLTFDVGHGTFWPIFGVEILLFLFIRFFIFFVFISDGSNRILCEPQCVFSFLAYRILDF